jgi:YggT family protein
MNPTLASLTIQLLGLLSTIVGLFQLVVILAVILSWLIAFDIVNTRNRTVYQLVTALQAVSDRLLYPIRRFLPSIAGLDLSPLVFLFLCQVVKTLISSLARDIALSVG